MEEAMAAGYWCHRCSQMVNPIMEVEIKCPFCQTGFIEEMSSTTSTDNQVTDTDTDTDFGSDRALSLWAPILLGMMGNPPRRRRRRFRRLDFELGDEDNDDNDNDDDGHRGGETELDRELESIIRRRRRSSATILQLLQGIRAGMASELSENSEGDRDGERDRERERERLVLINPFNQTIIVQGSYDSSRGGQSENQGPIGSLGDYFIGPGFDLLLQHLAENDPNRYGTPPAQKEAIEALPTMTVKENLQCSVCLDDFEIGSGAKVMPCNHKFHSGCILPWLELHSSCPVCRFQLPADETKRDSDGSRSSSSQRERERERENGHGSGEDGDEGDGRSASGRRFSIPWPFNGLFSSSGGGNSSSTSSSSSANATGGGHASSQTDEN